MMRYLLVCVAVLAVVAMVGCKEEEPASYPAAPGPEVQAPTTASEDAEEAAEEALEGVEEEAEEVEDAVDEASGVDKAALEKAEGLLAQVKQYVKENKLDLADQALKRLDRMKGSLPDSLQGRIEQLHNLVKAAKATEKTESALEGAGGLLGK